MKTIPELIAQARLDAAKIKEMFPNVSHLHFHFENVSVDEIQANRKLARCDLYTVCTGKVVLQMSDYNLDFTAFFHTPPLTEPEIVEILYPQIA